MDINEIRDRINAVDERILESFIERMRLSEDVAEFKRANKLPLTDKARERAILKQVQERAKKLNENRKTMNEEVATVVKPLKKNAANPLVSGLGKFNPRPVMPERPGLVVKDVHKIDADKGFYIADQNGVDALIGKIGEHTFVLKRFDEPVDTKIQVRQDKDNVYMVRAGGFKSLVEVSGDNMGVLVEL